jgi:hypothetical protein
MILFGVRDAIRAFTFANQKLTAAARPFAPNLHPQKTAH